MSGTVAIIGGGAWGTALAIATAAAGHARVILWMRDAGAAEAMRRLRLNARYLPDTCLPPAVEPTADPADLGRADAVLVVLPTQALRDGLSGLLEALRPGAPLVACAKGIEQGTGRFALEILAEVAPGHPAAILSGPSFAADVARGLPTAVTLAAGHEALARDLARTFSGPALRVYHGTDVRGVEVGGAAKNVLAIAVGIVEGCRLGESAKAALVARGFAEITRFGAAAGARPETLMGLSGLGDLVLTCSSASSRNFALGVRIGRGEPPFGGPGSLAEGAFTAPALVGLARQLGVEMPIAEAVEAVLAERLAVADAVSTLMSRPLRAE